MMALTISLPDDAEARLRERAGAAGQDVTQYVEQLISKELVAPLSLAEAAEPLARAVDAAGVTDDEFTSILVEARDAVRRDRRKSG
jgi:predicted transcriptional regulator